MNWLAIPTLFLGFVAFGIGMFWARRLSNPKLVGLSWFAVVIMAIPALVYAGYYSKLFGEPVLLYKLRTLPDSELLASLAGFAAGWSQVRLLKHFNLSRLGSVMLVPVLLGFVLALPHLKPLFRPLHLSDAAGEWRDGVCLQSTGATCGPAAAATILRQMGLSATEAELAKESFTCASGTENWYLARALRRRRVNTSFQFDKQLQFSFPAIVGVRLINTGNAGHFIALLSQNGDQLTIADPLDGRSTNTMIELRLKYDFTGFLIAISRAENGEQLK